VSFHALNCNAFARVCLSFENKYDTQNLEIRGNGNRVNNTIIPLNNYTNIII